MITYKVEINFGGYIGCSNIYEVDADSQDEAEDMAKELAVDDLSVEHVIMEEDE